MNKNTKTTLWAMTIAGGAGILVGIIGLSLNLPTMIIIFAAALAGVTVPWVL